MTPLVVIIALVTVAAIAVAGFLTLRRRRTEAMTTAAPGTMAARYNCSQSWATCPGPDQMCYWGDQPYNKGRCCRFPWSSAAGCTGYDSAKYPKPEQCPAGTVVHDDGSCWDHKGSADSNEWEPCYKAVNRYRCQAAK